MTPPLRFEPLADHDRSEFNCGEAELDNYFRTTIGQDVRRNMASAYVAAERPGGRVVTYYTLSATSLRLQSVPQPLARRLPRYPLVPAVLVGRMAVALDWQGAGLGAAMLGDAAGRTMSSGLWVYALLVLPKSEAAKAFYQRHGFVPTQEGPEMLLPLAVARRSSDV